MSVKFDLTQQTQSQTSLCTNNRRSPKKCPSLAQKLQNADVVFVQECPETVRAAMESVGFELCATQIDEEALPELQRAQEHWDATIKIPCTFIKASDVEKRKPTPNEIDQVRHFLEKYTESTPPTTTKIREYP